MFRLILGRRSDRKTRSNRLTPQIDRMEERVVPATFGLARGAALAAIQARMASAISRATPVSARPTLTRIGNPTPPSSGVDVPPDFTRPIFRFGVATR
jgi:hypothetical protein